MNDAPAQTPSGGPETQDPPLRRGGAVIAYVVVGIVVAAAAVVGLSLLSSAVSGTVIRVVVAVALGVFIARFLWGYFKQATQPLPPDPEPEAVPSEVGLIYVCSICGLELDVRTLAKDKPPKHCGEDMKLYVEE